MWLPRLGGLLVQVRDEVGHGLYQYPLLKVSVKENEVPTEKDSSRASIFATKASYVSN